VKDSERRDTSQSFISPATPCFPCILTSSTPHHFLRRADCPTTTISSSHLRSLASTVTTAHPTFSYTQHNTTQHSKTHQRCFHHGYANSTTAAAHSRHKPILWTLGVLHVRLRARQQSVHPRGRAATLETSTGELVCSDCIKSLFEQALKFDTDFPARWGSIALNIDDFAVLWPDRQFPTIYKGKAKYLKLQLSNPLRKPRQLHARRPGPWQGHPTVSQV